MASWVVGDIHGCALELEALLEALGLGPDDALVCVGDLFHRGPDPIGVMELLRASGAHFVLGNHERAVLARAGLAPQRADASDRPPRRTSFPPLLPEDLAGDGQRPLLAPRERLGEVVEFLQGHAGYRLLYSELPAAGPTPDGREWLVVHAGVPPDRKLVDARPEELVYPMRVGGRRGPFWYERYQGPDLVLFGHLPNDEPILRYHDGALVALGLDTGCVYGGELSAYSPERDEWVRVRASRAWAQKDG